MAERPAYPGWHWLVTALCVVAGLLWAHFMMLLAANRAAPAPVFTFAVWFAGVAGGLEALHQGGRVAVWLARRLRAGLQARLPSHAPTGRGRGLPAPWPAGDRPGPAWDRWVTLAAVAAGLLAMTPIGYIAIDHDPMNVYSDEPGDFATLCAVYFGLGFLPLELSQQVCRLLSWCARQRIRVLRLLRVWRGPAA